MCFIVMFCVFSSIISEFTLFIGQALLFSQIDDSFSATDHLLNVSSIVHFAYFPLVAVNFVACCYTDSDSYVSMYEHPEERASLPSRLTFHWFTPLVLKGFRNNLDPHDMAQLSKENTCKDIYKNFEKASRLTLKHTPSETLG